jgi:Icc-related predicted phosphoesterase
VSDIHSSFDHLANLKTWYTQNPEKFDYIFATGDFDSMKISPGDAVTETNTNYTELTRNLSGLEHFSTPILYIPGNHDPIGLFSQHPRLTPNSYSIQNKSLLIAENLQVVGMGGSLPGYWEQADKYEINLDAYPYRNETEYNTDLQNIIEKEISKKAEQVQTVLLTHTGPYLSSTVLIYRDKEERNLWLGSKELEKVLKNPKWNILVNIHGHAHPGVGRANYAKLQIINPGSLVDGNFAIMHLKKNVLDKKWKISKTEFMDLN